MTNNLVETLLYKNEESAVSINVVIDQEMKQCGLHKKQ